MVSTIARSFPAFPVGLELPGEVIRLKGSIREIVDGIREINDVLQEVKTALETTTAPSSSGPWCRS